MAEPITACEAPAVRTMRGVFGDRCGKPATDVFEVDERPMCAECAAWARAMWAGRKHPNTLGSVLSRLLGRSTDG